MDEAHEDDFARWVEEAVGALPPELAERVENVAVEIADEEPGNPHVLGRYRGVPLTRRTHSYVFVLPDRITIYRRPLERLYGRDPARLRERVHHVVLHEIAHHFGISDERLKEIGRY